MKLGACVALLVGSAAVAAPARAQAPSVTDAKTAAKDAYKRGEAALTKNDFAVAATEFLHAFETLPNDVALKAACDAVVRTDDVALAARALEDASTRRSPDATQAAAAVEQRFGTRLGRVVIECRAASCEASESGKELSLGAAHWMVPGAHTIATRVEGGGSVGQTLDIRSGETARLVLTAPAAPPAANAPATPPPDRVRAPERGGISPVWVVVGGALTLVAAGVATWSTLDVTSIHDDYDAQQCATRGSAACDDVASRGKSADLRTAILWGVTGALGVVTLATGVFFVRWSGERAEAGVARAF